MKLYDFNAEKELSLSELFSDWKAFKTAEPWNHAENFKTELFEILMATINGRNDCEVVGPTASELDRIIRRIRREMEK